VGQGVQGSGKVHRRLTPRTFVTMAGSLQLTRRGLRPDLSASLGHQLDEHTVGYLTYSTKLRVREGEEGMEFTEDESGMCSMLVRDTPKYHATLSLQLGIPYTYAMAAYTRKLEKKGRKCRVAVKAGTFGAILEYGVEERVTSQSSLSATMVVGFPVGVTCRIKLTRASQVYLFPFHLSDEILIQPVFYGTVCPLIIWLTAKKLILEPMQARAREAARVRKREVNRERVAAARREAEASVALMEERYTRIRAAEEGRGGLVLVTALYGHLEDSGGGVHRSLAPWDPPSAPPTDLDYISVARPLQCEVEEGRLILWEGSKCHLPGLWDPAPGEEKHLLIRYLYQGVRHEVYCSEEDAVKLPKSSHRVPGPS